MVSRRATPQKSKASRPEFVHQFLIVLSGTEPLLWRRIQVPLTYSFWDLHVAIQDAMGWLDYHLHEFRLLDGKDKIRAIGIPTGEESPDARPPIQGWRVRVSDYFNHRQYHRVPALYVYDFGDDWEHALVYEGEQPIESSLTYPRCVAGARKCPPEDCGGAHGYMDFLAAISDPAHPERDSLLTWAGGSYDPDSFDPANVVFDDPLKRWKKAFAGQQ
jgi:pRiA4b ORF-3-like protein